MIDVDIIIISYKGFELTRNCINSIFQNKNINPNIIIVDNNSPDNTIDRIKSIYPNLNYIINSDNFGYAKAVNIGVKYSKSENIIISNNDVEFLENSIFSLISILNSKEIYGAVGPQQLFSNLTWQSSYGFNPSLKTSLFKFFFIDLFLNKLNKLLYKIGFNQNIKSVDYIDGAVIATKKRIFNLLNGFDEDYFFYSEEADYCKRIQNMGFKTISTSKSLVKHLRGAASNGNLHENNIKALINSKQIYMSKHLSKISNKIYIYSEIFQNCLISSLLKIILKFSKKEHILKKQKIFNIYCSCWKSVLNK